MRLGIGDLVHNDATQEQGRIVRFFNGSKRLGCIVATKNKMSGQEIEALGFPRDIKEFKERAQMYRSRTTDHQPETGPGSKSVEGI